MSRRLAGLVGWCVILAAGALGAAGLWHVQERVRIVIEAERPAGPEPLALLRDEVTTLQRDVGALVAALEANLRQLAASLDGAQQVHAAGCREDVRRLTASLERWQQSVDGTTASLSAAIARLADRQPDGQGAPVAAGAETMVVTTPMAPADARTATGPDAAAGNSPGGDLAREGAPPAQPAQGGFLNFRLPSRTFRFDQPHDFVLLPDLSRVGFDATSTLHDFSGVTQAVTGELHADLHDPAGTWSGRVVCQAGTLLTGVDGRDEGLREHLATSQHPDICFEITGFEPAANGIDAAHETVQGAVLGRMTIRGRTRDLRVPIRAAMDAGRRLVVEGQAPLKLSDYEVPVPSKLGVISMGDEVKVWVALRLRVGKGG